MFGHDVIGTLVSGGISFMGTARTIKYFEAVKPTGKQALEEMQLLKFKSIAEENFPEYDFESYELSTDPPDYLITRKGIQSGMELTAFGDATRKRDADKLLKLKQVFKSEFDQGRLHNIKGFGFVIKFKNDVLKSKSRTSKAIQNVIDFLDKLVVPPNFEELLFSHSIDTPGPFPHPHGASYSEVDIEMYISSYSQAPLSRYMAECGFDFDIDDQNNYVIEDAIADLNAIISEKDISLNEELLIIAGGPNQLGIGNGDEANALSHFVKDAQNKLNSPKHLKSIFILFWPHAKIHKLEIPIQV